jgi:multiple sugar transport system permease protein
MTAHPDPHRSSRQRRLLIENLTAYAFLTPAAILIFIFGVFPVLFAFFVSVHRWRRFPDEYIGLGNYEQALGNFSYVLFFWAALGLIGYGAWQLWRLWQTTRTSHPLRDVSYALPGILIAATVIAFGQWMALALPAILTIPRRILGQERVEGLFVRELVASFQQVTVYEAGNLLLLLLGAALVVSQVWVRVVKGGGWSSVWWASGVALLIGVGALLLVLTLTTINTAIDAARTASTELPVWTQIILISAGAGLIFAAYRLWGRAVRAAQDGEFLLLALVALMIAGAGYVFIAELPRMLASADQRMLNGFNVTVIYALIAVPIQLAFGLGLAYLLFQKIRGKTFFRMVFFLPYVMPFLATALVFTLLFSHREDSIMNNVIGFFGVPPQKWLLEPIGIGRLMLGESTPALLNGPSLALVVVIIYTVWTYTGYATVVFLAGLGNIPGELYEAARIDGASGWAIFRYVTLPLLSPTTFFLSLVAVIGTFQAFTQLWLMRTPAARDTLDTMSIVIFREITDSNPSYGYGSALAFVLFVVILLLTLVQNRLAERRVFYG